MYFLFILFHILYMRAFACENEPEVLFLKALTVVLRAAMPAAVLAALLAFFPFLSELSPEKLASLAPDSLLLAAALLFALYMLKAVTVFIPLDALFLCAGMLFPPFSAILLSYVFLAAESALGFHIGRRMGAAKVLSLLERRAKLRRLVAYCEAHGDSACFLARLSPLTFDLVSYYFGSTKISFKRYMAGTLLGITPKLVPFTLAGAALLDRNSPRFALPVAVSLLLSFSMFFLMRNLDKRRLKKAKN